MSTTREVTEVTEEAVSELFDKATTALIAYLAASRKLMPDSRYPSRHSFTLDLGEENIHVSLGQFRETIRRK